MATIKDIAKLTGLSHTTVSNVINKNGNVSIEKIRIVEEAAIKLGYSQNIKAKLLRNSKSKQIAIIVPNLEIPEYLHLYLSAKSYIEDNGFECELFLTDDIVRKEKDAIARIAGFEMAGVIAISTLDHANLESIPDSIPILYVERKNSDISGRAFIGFDYAVASEEIAEYIKKEKFQNIAFLSGGTGFSNNSELFMNLQSHCINSRLFEVSTIPSSVSGFVFSMLHDNPATDLIIATSESYIEEIREAHLFCSMDDIPRILCLASNPKLSDGVEYYILDYRKLGREAAKQIITWIHDKRKIEETITVKPSGFSDRFSHLAIPRNNIVLNILFQETPSSLILTKISKFFTKETGIEVRFTRYSYQDQINAIRSMEPDGFFDVIRLDMTWLESLRDEYLMELSNLDSVTDYINSFPEYMVKEYVQPEKGIFTIPSEPSVQLFFYRKDLFEDPFYSRQYTQLYGDQLKVPTSYEELLKISKFFTKSLNPSSPTEFGGTTVMEYPSTAVCDFAPRMMELSLKYTDEGLLDFESEEMLEALNLYNESFNSSARNKIWWGDAAKEFALGRNATTTVYTNHAFMMLSSQNSGTIGQIGFATVPGGHPLLGGSSLAIGRHSKHPVEALEFIKWITSEQMAETLIKTGGMSPRISIFSDAWLQGKYPWINIIEENYRKGISRNRIFYKGDAPFRFTDFESVFGVALQSMLDNTMTPYDVAHFISKCIRNFLRK